MTDVMTVILLAGIMGHLLIISLTLARIADSIEKIARASLKEPA